ncbi:MAG: hypothetical protein LUF28_09435 [Clostridiales bacterium]|nr:hypothetical protein [Clostridiales bacterium]
MVNFPGDPEAGLKTLQPMIKAHRKEFLNRFQVGVTACYWKDRDGKLVLDREERIPVGTGAELMNGEVWLPQKFARIPDVPELQVRVYIDNAERHREVQVHLPNLMGRELQELGMKVVMADLECKLVLLLRNSTEGPVASDGIALLGKD